MPTRDKRYEEEEKKSLLFSVLVQFPSSKPESGSPGERNV